MRVRLEIFITFLLFLFYISLSFNLSAKCDLANGDFSTCRPSGAHPLFYNKSVEFYKVSALWYNIYEELFFALSCNDDESIKYYLVKLLDEHNVNFLRITLSNYNNQIYETLRRLGELSMLRPLPYHRKMDYETLFRLKTINSWLEADGLCIPKEERGSIYFDVYDPYFVERKVKLTNLTRKFSNIEQIKSDFPEIYTFLDEKSPLWLSELFIKGILTFKRKEVEKFTDDLFDIVRPRERIFVPDQDRSRRLTALYAYLLEILAKEPNNYIYYLRELKNRVKNLEKKSLWSIANYITRDKTKTLRLLAMLSHNHLFEIYSLGIFSGLFIKNERVGETIFNLIDESYRAINETAIKLNGKFLLVSNEENGEAIFGTPDDFYHFFAAAFVANELKVRKNPEIFINLAGEFIGYFYETHNHNNQRKIDRKDVKLHKMGTEFGISIK